MNHTYLVQKQHSRFQHVTNPDKLPDSHFKVMALPMKIRGGSGAPLRIVALLE